MNSPMTANNGALSRPFPILPFQNHLLTTTLQSYEAVPLPSTRVECADDTLVEATQFPRVPRVLCNIENCISSYWCCNLVGSV